MGEIQGEKLPRNVWIDQGQTAREVSEERDQKAAVLEALHLREEGRAVKNHCTLQEGHLQGEQDRESCLVGEYWVVEAHEG